MGGCRQACPPGGSIVALAAAASGARCIRGGVELPRRYSSAWRGNDNDESRPGTIVHWGGMRASDFGGVSTGSLGYLVVLAIAAAAVAAVATDKGRGGAGRPPHRLPDSPVCEDRMSKLCAHAK